MKNSAIVNGMTITREQAEKALEEMNRVEYPSFKAGQKVEYDGKICVVLSEFVAGRLRPTHPLSDYTKRVCLVGIHTGEWYVPKKDEVKYVD